MEIEVKLALDPSAARALRGHPLLAHYRQGAPTTRTLENRYHDTPSLDLQRQGLELRLRRIGARHQQTLKVIQGGGGGLHRKHEWEVDLTGPRLDIAALAALLPRDAARVTRLLRAYAARDDLDVRVTTRYRRTTWLLRSAQGDVVEAALDRGEILAAERALPLCELELELKAGQPRALFELASALHADLTVHPETRGKAERGFALLRGQPESPRHARPVPIHRGLTPAQALRTIVEECLAQVQANQHGIADSADAEYVHQARVGLRRLRSALGLFKGIANPPAEVLGALRWSASELGHARDAEVLVHETLQRMPVPSSAEIDWQALLAAATRAADQTRHRALSVVRDPRHAGWQLALMAWVWSLDGAAPAEEPLSAFSARQLRRLKKRLVAWGKRLPGTDAADRHETRIAAKKLRYATELLGALRPPRPNDGGLRALAALQQQLGLLNDAEVAETLLSGLAAEAPALHAATLYAQGWLAADAQWRVRRLGKLWQQVRAQL